jgi:pyruvate/2-oxoglutarate dehydrogenase complex dihydrolipoamide dehydrogenase (E3) component
LGGATIDVVGIEPDGLMQAVGRTPNGMKVKKGPFPWTASGRAIANGRDEGVTKLLFDDSPEANGHVKIQGDGMAAEVAHGSCTDVPSSNKAST